MGRADRSLLIAVEIVPCALTPSGLSVLGLFRDGARPGRLPHGEFSLPTGSFDLALMDHPLAAARATAEALFVPGDWSDGALYLPTSWRYGDSPAPAVGERMLHELIFTVALAMVYPVAVQRRYRDMSAPALEPAWAGWDAAAETETVLADLQRPTHDAPTCRKVAQHAMAALRADLSRRPERLATLFSAGTRSQVETSLLALYGTGRAQRAEVRRLVSALAPAAKVA